MYKGVTLQYTYPDFEADVVVDVRDLPLEYVENYDSIYSAY